MQGLVQGTKFRRPFNRFNQPTIDLSFEKSDRFSLNPIKINLVLLFMVQRIVSFRSCMVLEPIMRLLCEDAVPVRKVAFDVLCHVQRAYKSKRTTLVQLYLVALKYPNSNLRTEVLRLLCLCVNENIEDEISQEQLLQKVLPLLDDDSLRVKE